MPLTRALLTSFCAALLVLPTSPLHAAPPEDAPVAGTAAPKQPEAAEPEQTDAAKTAPSDVGGDTQADDLQAAMVRAFTDRFQEGKFLFNRGAYAQAATEFERAFAAIPAEAALFNVALSYERARDLVSAALAARRYMELPDCAQEGVDPALCGARREEVEAQLERLMAQIGELRLDITKGVLLAEVIVNGRKIAVEDFPLLVAAGRIDVELVEASTRQRRQRLIDVRPGERQSISVTPFVVENENAGRIGPRGREAKPRPKWVRPLFWSSVGITAASAIAMATMGGLLLDARKRYDAAICDGDPETPTRPCPSETGDYYPHKLDRQRHQYRMTTNVLVGVTAGLALITAVVGVVAFTGEDARRRRNAGTQRASTRVRWQAAGMLVHF